MSAPIFCLAPSHMRYGRESLFEPKFVSIGPLYYEKLKEQKVIEKAKEECISYYASKLLNSTGNPINDLVKQINVAEVKEKIHKWYGNSIVLPEDDNLFQMLVTDSCFIIRIILAFSREGKEGMFSPGVDIKTIRLDLLLMENQIPFFILKKVYEFLRANEMLLQVPDPENSTSNSNSQDHEPTSCVCCIFRSSPGGHTTCMCFLPISFKKNNLLDPEQGHFTQHTLSVEHSQSQIQSQSRRHLLQSSTPQSQSHSPHESSPEQTTNLNELLKELQPFIWCNMPWQFYKNANFTDEPKHLLDLYWKWCIPFPSDGQGNNEQNNPPNDDAHASWEKIHARHNAPKRVKNANELHLKAGVTFQKRKHNKGFGVTFQNGILQIPHLQLDPNQINLLANLVAFEESKPSTERLLTSYVLLMDGLINTEKDVELLQQLGLITNKLSSTQVALTYFNDIGNFCSVNDKDHFCQKQFDDINNYYSRGVNRYAVMLKRRYYDNPWAANSFIAGVLVLYLALIQTFYNIYSFYRHQY